MLRTASKMAANANEEKYIEVCMLLDGGGKERVAVERESVWQIQNGDKDLAKRIISAYNEGAKQIGGCLAVSMIILPEKNKGTSSSASACEKSEIQGSICEESFNQSVKTCKSQPIHQWNESEERLLLSLRASMEDKFTSTKAHSVLWNEIRIEMQKEGVYITMQQVKDKWRNLKRKYTETVDLNNKTGNAKHSFKYFDIFSQLYRTKASTKPLFVLDTSQGQEESTSDICKETLFSEEKIAESQVNCSSNNLSNSAMMKNQVRKRQLKGTASSSPRNKIVKLLESLEEKNEEFNQFIKQQEEQKMKRYDRFLDLFGQSLRDKK